MEGTGKGWAESGLQAGQLSLFLTSPRPGRAGEPGTRHVLREDKLSLSHCPVARAVLVAGMHSPVCVTSWGSCWPPPTWLSHTVANILAGHGGTSNWGDHAGLWPLLQVPSMGPGLPIPAQ